MSISKGDRVSATTSELHESQVHIWKHMFSFISSMSLKCAVKLNIPDIIHAHARPMTLSNLAQALEINPDKATHLSRLMQILTHSGFFKVTTNPEIEEENQEEDEYSLTPACRLILKDEPACSTSFIKFILDPIITEPFHNLDDFLKNSNKNVFDTTYGTSYWEYLRNDEELGGLFNDSMGRDSALIGKLVVEKCGRVFEGLRSVVDVAGGTGTLARTFAGAFPEIEWTVLDLPHVVNGLAREKNLQFVGGDMFQSVPNADAVVLKLILHDWNDEECVTILKKCKEAIPTKGGKVIIIDAVINKQNTNKKSTQVQLYFDILMMALLTGRERDEKGWSKLFTEAGFSDYKVTNLGVRSIIELNI